MVERCIYGVDINPLAVEFARVSLWVETLDPELPFSFLDHKIKVGNSLVGCWLDRVLDYPLKAWEREGGDGKDGPRTQRIEEFLKGPKGPNGRRTGDGIIKKEMRQLIESRFSQQPSLFPDTTTTAGRCRRCRSYSIRTAPRDVQCRPGEEGRLLPRLTWRTVPPLRSLKRAMDEWCAVWFWPADEESLKHVPTPLTFHRSTPDRTALSSGFGADMRFFHWELAFPDVFTPQRSGFDAMLGNPPWEVMKPNSQEFFTEFDPLYRTYDKQTALAVQQKLRTSSPGIAGLWDDYNGSFKSLSNWVGCVAQPFDVPLALGKQGKDLAASWAKVRQQRVGFAVAEKPFRSQGSADLNSFKLFLEIGYRLLTPAGRMGLIVPSGLYTDLGCHDLRELFLNQSTWDWLFGFINWEQIFNIYYRFKFVCTIVDRRAPQSDHAIRSCFGRYKLRDWEDAESVAFPLPKKNILEFSPKTLSILEITNQRDLDICRKIYANSFRIGDATPGWEITYACEFHMTNDSKHFSLLEKWRAKGYQPDAFGRWIGPDGDVALPLYEGRMIGQFDFSQKGYVRGRGRSAVWRERPFDDKTIEPQFLMAEITFTSAGKAVLGWKLVGMSIASSTNSRTVISACQAGVPCNHALFTLRFRNSDVQKCLTLEAAFNAFAFDYAIRQRVGGLNLSWFIIEEGPLPSALTDSNSPRCQRLLHNAAAMTLVHRRFAPDWLSLRNAHPRPLDKAVEALLGSSGE